MMFRQIFTVFSLFSSFGPMAFAGQKFEVAANAEVSIDTAVQLKALGSCYIDDGIVRVSNPGFRDFHSVSSSYLGDLAKLNVAMFLEAPQDVKKIAKLSTQLFRGRDQYDCEQMAEKLMQDFIVNGATASQNYAQAFDEAPILSKTAVEIYLWPRQSISSKIIKIEIVGSPVDTGWPY